MRDLSRRRVLNVVSLVVVVLIGAGLIVFRDSLAELSASSSGCLTSYNRPDNDSLAASFAADLGIELSGRFSTQIVEIEDETYVAITDSSTGEQAVGLFLCASGDPSDPDLEIRRVQ